MTDEDFASALDAEVSGWRALSERVATEWKLQSLGPGEDAARRLRMKLAPLFEAWWKEPLAGKMLSVGHIGTVLSPGTLCWWALEVAAERDAAAAVKWLRKVLTTEKADGRFVASLTGVTIEAERELVDGFHVAPRPDEDFWSGFDRHVLIGGLCSMPVKGAAFIRAAEDPGANQGVRAAQQEVRARLPALALAGAAARMYESWFEFDDSDFRRFTRSAGRFFTLDQQAHFWAPKLDLDEAEKFLPLYLNLTGRAQKSVTVALERLISARVELSPGDRAIDGAIAMEALFLADEKDELKYRLRVRAARLLGTSLAERETISATIAKFYDLRSAVVHGSKSSSEIDSEGVRKIIEDGLGYVEATARHICEAGRMPNWTELELR